jgi:hypothetical protein
MVAMKNVGFDAEADPWELYERILSELSAWEYRSVPLVFSQHESWRLEQFGMGQDQVAQRVAEARLVAVA